MIVRVKLFAVARQRAGQDHVDVRVPSTSPTVAGLRAALADQCPQLASLLPHVKVAVNNDYVVDSALIPEYAEVAIIPPVSGG